MESVLGFSFRVATIAWRNRIAVRASFGVAKKSADAMIELGADDVLELAGLVAGFDVVDGESVFEEALG